MGSRLLSRIDFRATGTEFWTETSVSGWDEGTRPDRETPDRPDPAIPWAHEDKGITSRSDAPAPSSPAREMAPDMTKALVRKAAKTIHASIMGTPMDSRLPVCRPGGRPKGRKPANEWRGKRRDGMPRAHGTMNCPKKSCVKKSPPMRTKKSQTRPT
jgi:hypothetical protein